MDFFQNVNECYSSHYIETNLQKDIEKEWQHRWRKAGKDSTPEKLKSLSKLYKEAKTDARRITLIPKRWQQQCEKDSILSTWHKEFLKSLGYDSLVAEEVKIRGDVCEILHVERRNEKPWVYIIETAFALTSDYLSENSAEEDPFSWEPSNITARKESAMSSMIWSKILVSIFATENAPRWIIFTAGAKVYLLDRDKFADGRYVSFDLDKIFSSSRPSQSELEVLSTFLSRETLCSSADEQSNFVETINEQSTRFSHGVSEKLQYAVKEAVEILANEYLDWRALQGYAKSRRRPEEMSDGEGEEITAEELRHEALVYVYRMLFCLYAEARSEEIGVLPLNNADYRLGYSFEALRDLEAVELGERSKQGSYFHQHLKRLFSMIREGYQPEQEKQDNWLVAKEPSGGFRIEPLTATLFDLKEAPLFERATFSNQSLQKVIRRLSLAEVRVGQRKSLGRVNYAELGINQLGAVYEGLLSYSGKIAKEELIQVKRAGDDEKDKKTSTWFVPSGRQGDFELDEIVKIDGASTTVRKYKKDTFYLHLSGVDREMSASYYTPEVLTKCLVEETLDELTKDFTSKDADKVLELKVLEPAMGSGAFLNEVADQLSDLYLKLKQEQVVGEGGEPIAPEKKSEEKARVKHHIAVNNIYGVDLNPTAVELGGLSLWLGSIHKLKEVKKENGFEEVVQEKLGETPWFRLRLRAGNSLIGARRAVWKKKDILAGRYKGIDAVIPRQLKPGEARAVDEIYHFLIWGEDPVPTYKSNKLPRESFVDEREKVKAWVAKEHSSKYLQEDVLRLLSFSEMIDKHWVRYSEERLLDLSKTKSNSSVWPQPINFSSGLSLAEKNQIADKLESTSGSFQRLKLIMDTWASLWFWRLTKAEILPSRNEWMVLCEILLSDTVPYKEVLYMQAIRLNLENYFEVFLSACSGQVPDIKQIANALPWVREVIEIAEQERFFHWELQFSEVLGPEGRGGFDVVVGNPPWIKITWNDAAILPEFDPKLGVRNANSGDYEDIRSRLLSNSNNLARFLYEYERIEGIRTFLTDRVYHSELTGTQTNLYKVFVLTAWRYLSADGVKGLLHPDGVFEEKEKTLLRGEYYTRLRKYLQFANELKWFADVGNRETFSVVISGSPRMNICFDAIFNLFHPTTIKLCRENNSSEVFGLKSSEGNKAVWELRGNKDRIAEIKAEELKIFSKLFTGSGSDWQASQLPRVHNKQISSLLAKFANSKTIREMFPKSTVESMFHESGAKQKGQIHRLDNPSFQPQTARDCILTGPLIYVGCPIYQNANTISKTHRAYSPIDLTEISEDFLPRTVYKPGKRDGSTEKFEEVMRQVGTNGQLGRSVVEDYRFAYKLQASLSGERTLIGTIVPREVSAVNTLMLMSFSNIRDLVRCTSLLCSLPLDFITKVKARAAIYEDDIKSLPVIDGIALDYAFNRMLRLTCLTKHFDSLWTYCFNRSFLRDRFVVDLEQLDSENSWDRLNSLWQSNFALKTDFGRRQAHLEIDALVAIGLGLSFDELESMYKIQFPVLQEYESVDEYDSKGRKLPNSTRKEPGQKEVVEARKDHDGISPLTVSWKLDGGKQTVTKTFYPPFTKVDRVEDYRQAWEVFTERFAKEKEKNVGSKC